MQNMKKMLALVCAFVLAQNSIMEAAQTTSGAGPVQTINGTYMPTRTTSGVATRVGRPNENPTKPVVLGGPATPLYPVNSSGPSTGWAMEKMGHQGENPTAMTNLQPLADVYANVLQAVNKTFDLEPVAATKLTPAEHQIFAELQAANLQALTALKDFVMILPKVSSTELKNAPAKLDFLTKVTDQVKAIPIITPTPVVITIKTTPTNAPTSPFIGLSTIATTQLTPAADKKREQSMEKAKQAIDNAIRLGFNPKVR